MKVQFFMFETFELNLFSEMVTTLEENLVFETNYSTLRV